MAVRRELQGTDDRDCLDWSEDRQVILKGLRRCNPSMIPKGIGRSLRDYPGAGGEVYEVDRDIVVKYYNGTKREIGRLADLLIWLYENPQENMVKILDYEGPAQLQRGQWVFAIYMPKLEKSRADREKQNLNYDNKMRAEAGLPYHSDPHYDNIMRDKDGTLKFIDPESLRIPEA